MSMLVIFTNLKLGISEKKVFEGLENIQEKFFYLDEEKNCEVDYNSIKWIFILDMVNVWASKKENRFN